MKMDLRRGVNALACLLVLSACAKQKTASSVFEKAGEDCSSDVVPEQFVVKFIDGSLKRVSAASKDEFLNGFVSENLDQIDFAEHDFSVHVSDAVVRSEETTTTYADNWGVSRVNAASLWQQGVRGAGVIVAVVDTGMDLTHPQLRKQIAVNVDETGMDAQGRDKSINAVDDDGNGYVDDAYGFDFVKGKALATNLSAAVPFYGDYAGHGTHVSGIIAGAHTDTTAFATTYVQGLAPAARLLPLAFLDEKGSGSMLNAVYAIRYAVMRGAKVINASWGGSGCSRSLKEEIAGLDAQGVIFVAAAGNDALNVDRSYMYPASLEAAAQIVVGATGDHDTMASYSNYGMKHVHIFAPGTDITSTFPGGVMATLSGTSMATPFVTGAIALLLSAKPAATVDQIRKALYDSASKRNDYINTSQGRMDLARALASLPN